MLVEMRPVESSENITIMDEIDELLGTRRSYGWNSGSRPSMISAKYRLKEERRKVLKISVNKMKKIDDAESSLCRSVLINNTVKRLQAETRDDRTTGRTSPASPPSPTSAGYGYHSPQQSQPCGGQGGNPQLVDITNLRESSCTNGTGGVGVGGNPVTVGKTLANNNNNNNTSSNNNNKPLTEAQSLLAADHHHHHHHLLHHHHLQHHHHNNNHHHHHHHQQLQQQQHHQHLHHHHHQQQQQQQQQSSSVTAPGGPLPYGYDDEVDDEDVDDEEVDDDDVDDDTIASIMMHLPSSSPRGKRKRCVDEPLDDLLSQFINNNQREDEDVNVVDLDLHEYPAAKRLRTDEAAAAAAAAAVAAVVAGTTPSAADATPLATDLCSPDCWSLMDACCDDSLDLYGGQVPAAVEHQDVLLQPTSVTAASVDCCSSLSLPPPPPSLDEQHHHYGVSASSSSATGSTSPTNLSCGQASMFSEMQSAMFRNLIASLES
ncbi:uncharacterized protein LOC100571760 [Acyrthosiphon pisum]|uniref:SERTA domain-containing protein n=1 Tax=Acyrthosiphon pisum TaxID=7029 RepID=A0A8R2JUD8_ACYPI|nr:uncharacterized protein LOC100571760 [Acyrthosiphon pisum]XP_029347612.1 uncharacterized protein LOC100571760 [Acyrthosiphon pisum]|eukprot:XP_003240664.1 PREDICTED: uncharacterized protein LOC100571760 [Acyrthosiphon pisum]